MIPPRPPHEARLVPGAQVGAFEILDFIGQGGMGAVYRVRNRITGELRALKVMLPELASNPEFVNRFVREIRLAVAVDHPNLVRIYEPGMAGQQIFLPMELLEGETLAARLRHEPLMSIPAAVAVVYSTGAAIAALHAKGIVHRDVKPSNIVLVRRDGHTFPKLLDLGAGKEVGAIEDVTAAGMIIGSPHYMAPEQASGRKDLDARVDQYALAVVAYQALTGSRPFENDDTGHVLAKVLAGVSCRPPRELRPEVPAELEAVILKAMSRAREDRYPSVEGFVMELRRTLDDARAVAASLLSTRELVAPLTVTPGAGGRIEAHEKTGPMAVVAKPDASRSGALPLVALAMVVAVVLAVVVVKFGLGDARPVVAAPPPRPSLTARPPPPSPVASTAPMVAADPSAVAAPVATPGAASSGNPVASSAPSSSSMELPANAPHDRPTPAPRPRPSVRPSPGETPCRPTPGSPCL